MQYVLDARIIDASRREARGQGTVRVTRQSYGVLASREHAIHRPGENASIRFKATDANEQPVEVAGTVTVSRRRWGLDGLQIGRYEESEVFSSNVTTRANGEAICDFRPTTTGYFAVCWRRAGCRLSCERIEGMTFRRPAVS
jgi:hypothetical protein